MIVPTPVDGFQIESLDGELVLLHPTRNIIIHSNQTGALIWQLCDGARTVEEITEILGAAYPEARDEIRADVPAVIQTLASRGALESK
ncbi:MAG: PqqD family protein [Chloroflexi bacterium]|nr:PqqD family protein [Chloroflexota bacterium]